jgi:hypothetical protein
VDHALIVVSGIQHPRYTIFLSVLSWGDINGSSVVGTKRSSASGEILHIALHMEILTCTVECYHIINSLIRNGPGISCDYIRSPSDIEYQSLCRVLNFSRRYFPRRKVGHLTATRSLTN